MWVAQVKEKSKLWFVKRGLSEKQKLKNKQLENQKPSSPWTKIPGSKACPKPYIAHLNHIGYVFYVYLAKYAK